MGNNCTSKKISRRSSFEIDKEPDDTQSFNKLNLPNLQFQIWISNIKLKNAPIHKKLSIHIQLQRIINFHLEQRGYTENIKWKIEQKKRFTINQYHLRKKFVSISVIDNDKNVIGRLLLNLYYISTGPYHQDFPIQFFNKSIGRISVDIRVSQIVDIEIKPYKTTIFLVKDHPNEAFHYSLKTITYNYQQVQSKDSYNSQIKLYKRSNIQANEQKEETDKGLGIVRLKSKKSYIDTKWDKIVWTEQEAHNHSCQLPYLKSKLLVNQIADQFFQFLLWKNNQVSSECEQDHQIKIQYAQCHISYNKIFIKQPTIVQKKGIQYQVRDVEIEQKIWNQGKLYGTVHMSCRVTVPRFIKQMVVCIRTQKGILPTSPVFDYFLDKSQGQCQQITQLNSIKQTIQAYVIQLTNLKNEKRKNQFRILNIKRGIYQEIGNILKIFEAKKKKSIFIYKSQRDLIKGQMSILDIAFKLFSYLEEQEVSISQLCWKTLIAIMNRDQLTLFHMGFTKQEKKCISQNQCQKILLQKIEARIKYQTFLYYTLKIVLHCLSKKALLENERSFAQLFCSYSFFRIPQFRKKFLSILPKQDDPQIKLWKALQINLREFAQNLRTQYDPFCLLFDWQQNFYKPLMNQEKYHQNYAQLQQILELNDWKQKMSKRSTIFFYFLIYLIQYIEKIIVSGNIVWHALPGYTQLITAFLCQMNIRPILKYPDSLKQASVLLLCNENLLNIFIHLLFQKTNLMQSVMTIKTIQLVNEYFQYFIKSKKRIPSNFDYKFFYNALKQILSIDHSFTVAKCIQLIYNNYNIFSSSFRKDISLLLMGKLFFKLFLNWASNIRIIFHHLLIYRIYFESNILHKQNQEKNLLKSQHQINQQILRRYSMLMLILQNGKCIKIQEEKSNFKYSDYQKEYYRKIKKKVTEKRKNRRRNQEIMDQYENFNRNPNINIQKYSTQNLNKITVTQRYKSSKVKIQPNQLFKPIPYVLNPIQDGTNSQCNQDINFKSLKKQKFLYKGLQPIIQIKQFDKKIKKIYTNHTDFQIPQKIDNHLLEYLQKSLEQFQKLKQQFNDLYENKKLKNAPQIKIRYPLDQGDIRPDDIDEL